MTPEAKLIADSPTADARKAAFLFRLSRVDGSGPIADLIVGLCDTIERIIAERGKLQQEAKARAALAGTMSDWRDLGSAPKDGTPILFWDNRCAIAETVCYLNGSKISKPGWYPYAGGNWFVAEGEEGDEARWMPLPNPPESK